MIYGISDGFRALMINSILTINFYNDNTIFKHFAFGLIVYYKIIFIESIAKTTIFLIFHVKYAEDNFKVSLKPCHTLTFEIFDIVIMNI